MLLLYVDEPMSVKLLQLASALGSSVFSGKPTLANDSGPDRSVT